MAFNIKPKITYKSVSEIKEYANNPRNNDNAVDAVAASIKNFGFKVPIVLDKKGVIIAGHTRLKAAKRIGMTEVPCIVADDLDDTQAKAYRLVDNRVGELATWDDVMLGLERADLDIDLTQFGFEIMTGEPEEDYWFDIDSALEMARNAPGRVIEGDKWHLGGHILVCGDSTTSAPYEAALGTKRANIVLADMPPLAENIDYTAALQNMIQRTASTGSIYVFHEEKAGGEMRRAFNESEIKLVECCVWVNSPWGPMGADYRSKYMPILLGKPPKGKQEWFGGRTQRTVWEFPDERRSEEREDVRPVALMAYPVENSTQANAIVLDPFAGAGSALIACEEIKRGYRGIEKDPVLIDVCIQRYIEYNRQTGATPEIWGERNQEKILFEYEAE